MSLHSVRTAESVYVSNGVMVDESLKIVNMLDRFLAQNIFSQDMDQEKPSVGALEKKNHVLYYFKHPSFEDTHDVQSIDDLETKIGLVDREALGAVMGEGPVDVDTRVRNLVGEEKKVSLIDLLRAANQQAEDPKKIIPRTPTGASLYLSVSKPLHNLFLAVGASKRDSSKICEHYFWSFEMMRIEPQGWKDILRRAAEIQQTVSAGGDSETSDPETQIDSGDESDGSFFSESDPEQSA